MSDLIKLTISEALEGLRNKKFSAVELTTAYINQMEKTRHLKAYVLETPELALEMAKRSDARVQNNAMLPLEGMPLGIKDLYCTKGVRTTSCSKILSNFIPEYESTVTQNLWDAGSVMLGKLNMDQFAMGSDTTTSYFGDTINPWKGNQSKNLVPGGSSGGSAASVAAYSSIGATASDTGGSIRQPAAFCGLVGIKPTYGLCSRYGMVAFASSLDQAGPITRTVKDSALMLQYMAGHDPKDSTSVNRSIPDFVAAMTGDVRGMKIGIPKEYTEGLQEDIQKAFHTAIDWLKQAGAEIIDISLPHTKYCLPVYYIIAPAEASSNLSRYDGVRYGLRVDGHDLESMYENTRAEGFGDEVKRRILMGTYVLSSGFYDAYYVRAQKIKSLIYQDFVKAFEKVDAIFTPTTPSSAFSFDEKPTDPVQMYLNDVLTVSANLAEIPAMSIPIGLDSKGLPLGGQLMGPLWREDILFKVADVIEKSANFPYLMPEMVK